MKKNLVVDRTVRYRTIVFDFENGMLYVQNFENNRLRDDFFAHAGDLFPDGSIRRGKTKYFYSPHDDPEEKEIGLVKKPEEFKWFDRLFFYNQNGDIERIKNGR